jgi:hypothetical protein
MPRSSGIKSLGLKGLVLSVITRVEQVFRQLIRNSHFSVSKRYLDAMSLMAGGNFNANWGSQ